MVIIGLVFLLAACNQNSEPNKDLSLSDFAVSDEPRFVVSSGSSIYVAGESYSGVKSSFIRKYTWSIYDGSAIWTKYFGKYFTPDYERLTDIATDLWGNIYVSSTYRTPDDMKTSYVYKFDSAWNMLWKRKTNQTLTDPSFGVNSFLSTDTLGNVYIATLDKVVKYSSLGQLLLTFRLSDSDTFNILATPTGKIYIQGFGGLKLYNSKGRLLWSQQICGFNRQYADIALGPKESVYVLCTGSVSVQGVTVEGEKTAGLGFGFEEGDLNKVSAIASDTKGNLYLAGWTSNNIFGHVTNGFNDAFIMKYSFETGGEAWVRFLGGNGVDEIYDIAVGDSVYVVGKSASSPNLNKQKSTSFGFAARLRKSDGHVLGIDQ